MHLAIMIRALPHNLLSHRVGPTPSSKLVRTQYWSVWDPKGHYDISAQRPSPMQ